MASRARRAMWWVVDHWYLPVAIILAILGWFVFRWSKPDSKGAAEAIQQEMDIIRSGSEAREMQIQLGTDQALAHVRDKYQAKTVALDATQQAKVKELEDDPVALAKYLERITRG